MAQLIRLQPLESLYLIYFLLAQFEQERTKAGLNAARERGQKGGRKKTLPTDPKVLTARKMHQNHRTSINDIWNILKISRATFYRYLNIPDLKISLE